MKSSASSIARRGSMSCPLCTATASANRTWRAELMGLTLLEAMACGTPAICSRVGGMPEFIRHGKTGFVFDELGELTHYLRLLAGNPALVEHMGHQARLAVEQEYDFKAVGAKLVAVYEELISETQEVAA